MIVLLSPCFVLSGEGPGASKQEAWFLSQAFGFGKLGEKETYAIKNRLSIRSGEQETFGYQSK